MERREFIALLGGASVWPLAARAEQSDTPVIGLLSSGSATEYAARLKWYFEGLRAAGFTEGKNVKIEYRWAEGDNGKLAAMAADLVQRGVAVIVTPASTPATAAAIAATKTIPIVFAIGADPMDLGFVPSLAHPGGNVTGVTSLNTDVASKRLSLFRDLVPKTKRYFAMVNPTSPLVTPYVKDLEYGAKLVGIQVDVLKASTDAEIGTALATVAKEPGAALLCASDSFFYIRRKELVALANASKIPSAFDTHEYVDEGGLMSYGSDFSDVMGQAGRYTGRILKGEQPGDLPVSQSSKFEFAINLKTAGSLDITVPARLEAIATHVVED
jgi:putative tryptophan/tyrosine transport system substrate-binding protein